MVKLVSVSSLSLPPSLVKRIAAAATMMTRTTTSAIVFDLSMSFPPNQ